MHQTVIKKAASVHYWDGNAKWYKLWVEHNEYHNKIIEILAAFVLPGWKVLDIGAGNGILSFPLSAIGCDVIALEPSCGMRDLLCEEKLKRGINDLLIDERMWEEVLSEQYFDYDLIIACNSLHLTQMGFAAALEKVFAARSKHVFIVSEFCMTEIMRKKTYLDYTMVFSECYETESSHVYHCLEEALEHWSFKSGRLPYPDKMHAIGSELAYDNNHIWRRGIAHVAMSWWEQNVSYKA